MSDPGQNPYGQQNPYDPSATPPPYQHGAQQPYGQQPYPAQPYGQPGYAYPGYRPAPPNHPSATTAMVLGIIGLAGIMACGGITLVLSPFAWIMGGRALREIDAAPPGTVSGREQANAGRIMGIIGTVILILGVVLLVAFVVLLVASSATVWDGSYDG